MKSLTIVTLICLPFSALCMDEVFSGYIGVGNGVRGGGHMAVKTALYTPPQQSCGSYNLCAVSNGNDRVKLFIFEPQANPSLYWSEDVVCPQNLHPFDVSFATIRVQGNTAHSCLIIPLYDRYGNNGNIMVYDLETRIAYFNCLDWNGVPQTGQVYHVTSLENGRYAVTTGGNPGYICIASIQTSLSGPVFRIDETISVGAVNYACMAGASPGVRPYETYVYSYPSLRQASVAFTTCHNGGVLLWDTATNDWISWIRVGQWGGSGTGYILDDLLLCDGELGDMHRIAMILDSYGNPSLLFISNHTMGFMVYDVSDPWEPKYVWQWDNDTRMTSGQSFSWHGPGNGDVSPGYDPDSSVPGCVFGMGMNYCSNSGAIHAFIGDGFDGLLAFDFSYFFAPFSGVANNSERNFRYFDIYDNISLDHPIPASLNPLLAYEVRTIELSEEVYVFTTWREHIEDFDCVLGLTVYGDYEYDHSRRTMQTERNAVPTSLRVTRSNPSDSAVVLELYSPGGSAELSIFDMTGRVVLSNRLVIPVEGMGYSWNLCDSSGSPVPNGVYLIHLRDSSGRSVNARCTVIR